MLYFTIKSYLQPQQDLIRKSLRHLLPIKYIWSREQIRQAIALELMMSRPYYLQITKKCLSKYIMIRKKLTIKLLIWGWVDHLSLLVGLNTFGLSWGLLVTWSSYKDKKMTHVTKKYVYRKNTHVSLGCFLCKKITRKYFVLLKTFDIMERKTTLSLI